MAFNELFKLSVWAKGAVIPDYDQNVWRRDDFDTAMKYSDYGNRNSEYGWEIDHYPIPNALGGSETLGNSRPLNWKNNSSLGGLLSAALKR